MSEADPEQEAIETFRRTLSAGLMGAGQLAERVARHREQQLREAEADSQQRGQELERRFQAEHATARAVVADSRRPEFWEHARPRDVATAYEAAATWADRDPGMETDRRRIAAEVEKRYGVNVEDPHGRTQEGRTQDGQALDGPARVAEPGLVKDAATVGMVAEMSRQDRADAAAAEHDHTAAEQERAAALSDLGSTGSAEGAPYDSAEARLARAEALRATGMPEEAVQARSYADLGCSKPPAAAVESTPKPAAQSRTATPARTQGREQRRGLGG